MTQNIIRLGDHYEEHGGSAGSFRSEGCTFCPPDDETEGTCDDCGGSWVLL